MSVEIRVPTILRAYTDGQKLVPATGDTLAENDTGEGIRNVRAARRTARRLG